MSTSFPFIQSNQSIGPYGGTPTATFSSNVQFGDIVIVVWINGNSFNPDDTGVSDNQGNVYELYSYSGGGFHNFSQGFLQLYVAFDVAGGPLTVTIAATSSPVDNRQAIIIAEYEPPPGDYQLFGTEVDTSGNSSVQFTAAGGGGLTNTAPATPNEFSFNNPGSPSAAPAFVAVALMNQFQDVLIVGAYFLNLSSAIGLYPWVFASPSGGTVRETVDQPIPTYQSTALGDQDFPYLGGNLHADCNNLQNGVVGVAYDQFINIYGGTPPYTLSIVGGALPPGLSLNLGTGEITGTPTTEGRYNFTIKVVDNVGSIYTLTCSIAICPKAGGLMNAFY